MSLCDLMSSSESTLILLFFTKRYLLSGFYMQKTSLINYFNQDTEAVGRRCFVKKMFLKILQIHKKTPASEPLF